MSAAGPSSLLHRGHCHESWVVSLTVCPERRWDLAGRSSRPLLPCLKRGVSHACVSTVTHCCCYRSSCTTLQHRRVSVVPSAGIPLFGDPRKGAGRTPVNWDDITREIPPWMPYRLAVLFPILKVSRNRSTCTGYVESQNAQNAQNAFLLLFLLPMLAALGPGA